MANVRCYLKYQIHPTNLTISRKSFPWVKMEYLILGAEGGFAVSHEGKSLAFSFKKAEPHYTVINNNVYAYTNLMNLNIDEHRNEWIEAGIIKERDVNETIQEKVFAFIKKADRVEKVHVNVWDAPNNAEFDGSITLEEVTVFDDEVQEEINILLGKNFEGCIMSSRMVGIFPPEKEPNDYIVEQNVYLSRQFLKVDNWFIPMVLSSYTCHGGKTLGRIRWSSMKVTDPDKLLHTRDELERVFSGQVFRRPQLKNIGEYHESLSEWLISGIDEAVTIEEAISRGEAPLLQVIEDDEYALIEFESKDELYYLMNEYQSDDIDVVFDLS